MRIPAEKIEEVRAATDICELISASVRLKRRGKNHIGLCPFHTEKTPSFTVSPERQMYHCFGCGAGGNAFTFVMEHEKVSFVEAVRTLADRAGIQLPGAEQSSTGDGDTDVLYSILREAGLFFYRRLTGTEEGKGALEYLRSRGWHDETIVKFGLGYAPRSWDAFIQHARGLGYGPELLEKTGLAIRREDGSGCYDRFRGRVMFPVFSPSGRVIGFGARKFYDDDPGPKYLNSPETPVYVKGRVLYGVAQSREAIRRMNAAILVEGYADLITLFQAGIENVVASSGTALTAEQIQLIGRYTKNVLFVYDADSAGAKAMFRGLDLILEQDLDVRIARLPEGEDPDSFVKAHGGPAFQTLLEKAGSFIDFKLEEFHREGRSDDPEKQAEAVRSVVDSLTHMKDELKRDLYIKRLASKYDLYESVLRRELERKLKLYRHDEWTGPVSAEDAPSIAAAAGRRAPQKAPPVPPAERNLLKVLLEGPDEVGALIMREFSLDAVSNDGIRSIMGLVFHSIEEGTRISAMEILQRLDDPGLRSLLTDVTLSSYDLPRRYEISPRWDPGKTVEAVDAEKIAKDSILAIRRAALEAEIAQTELALHDAGIHRSDEAAVLRRLAALQQERQSLDRGLRE